MIAHENPIPLIENRLGLLSSKDVRYESVLLSINLADQSLSIQDVKNCSTEERDPSLALEVAESVLPSDCLFFDYEDMKDFTVVPDEKHCIAGLSSISYGVGALEKTTQDGMGAFYLDDLSEAVNSSDMSHAEELPLHSDFEAAALGLLLDSSQDYISYEMGFSGHTTMNMAPQKIPSSNCSTGTISPLLTSCQDSCWSNNPFNSPKVLGGGSTPLEGMEELANRNLLVPVEMLSLNRSTDPSLSPQPRASPPQMPVASKEFMLSEGLFAREPGFVSTNTLSSSLPQSFTCGQTFEIGEATAVGITRCNSSGDLAAQPSHQTIHVHPHHPPRLHRMDFPNLSGAEHHQQTSSEYSFLHQQLMHPRQVAATHQQPQQHQYSRSDVDLYHCEGMQRYSSPPPLSSDATSGAGSELPSPRLQYVMSYPAAANHFDSQQPEMPLAAEDKHVRSLSLGGLSDLQMTREELFLSMKQQPFPFELSYGPTLRNFRGGFPPSSRGGGFRGCGRRAIFDGRGGAGRGRGRWQDDWICGGRGEPFFRGGPSPNGPGILPPRDGFWPNARGSVPPGPGGPPPGPGCPPGGPVGRFPGQRGPGPWEGWEEWGHNNYEGSSPVFLEHKVPIRHNQPHQGPPFPPPPPPPPHSWSGGPPLPVMGGPGRGFEFRGEFEGWPSHEMPSSYWDGKGRGSRVEPWVPRGAGPGRGGRCDGWRGGPGWFPPHSARGRGRFDRLNGPFNGPPPRSAHSLSPVSSPAMHMSPLTQPDFQGNVPLPAHFLNSMHPEKGRRELEMRHAQVSEPPFLELEKGAVSTMIPGICCKDKDMNFLEMANHFERFDLGPAAERQQQSKTASSEIKFDGGVSANNFHNFALRLEMVQDSLITDAAYAFLPNTQLSDDVRSTIDNYFGGTVSYW